MFRYVLVLLTIVLLLAVFATNFFIKRIYPADENLTLVQENQDLRAQIQRYSIPNLAAELLAVSGTSTINANFLAVKVFSTYPFNIKSEITINAGADQGLKSGMVVVLGQNILIGQVKEVSAGISIVQTVFDPTFELPVRVGDKEIDSLFQGGSDPKIILIDKTKSIQNGDFVYSAGSFLPYGLKLGDVAEVKENMAGVFKEATVKIPFNVSDLRDVNVIINSK